jgi:protein-S-isoprenylcysteine O-methyltransferase Ste14
MVRYQRIREIFNYILGAILIGGFVFLYFSRFLFRSSMPPVIMQLLHGLGREWTIAINAAVFIVFLLFLPYRRRIAWRSKGTFAAFILALMADMFGLPLLMYIVSPLLPTLVPDRSLRLQFYGWLGQSTEMFVSNIGLILGAWLTLVGMLLIMIGWAQIHRAQGLATTGIYRYIRHPQYVGMFLILSGWILHWPTLVTILMYPILFTVYYRLARMEERELRSEFGEEYIHYQEITPGFFPNLKRNRIRDVSAPL